MHPELQKVLHEKWYTQGTAARPALIVSAGIIEPMQHGLGFSYEKIVGIFKEDYVEWDYLEEDLYKYGKLILEKLEKNPNYLKEKREQYNEEVNALEKDFEKAMGDLSKLGENELMDLLYRMENDVGVTVGTSHFLECIPFSIEKKLRHRLMENLSGKNLNEVFSTLTSPITPSFLSQKEEFLWKIKKASVEQKQKLAEQFIREFYWVSTSYVGKVEWDTRKVIRASEEIEHVEKTDFIPLKKKKEEFFQQLDFSEKEKQWIKRIEFSTDWQDERKKNILRAVYALDSVLHELSRRFGIEVKYLHYLLPHEITLQRLRDKGAEKIGKKRVQGVVCINKVGQQLVFDGDEFTGFEKKFRSHENEIENLTGMAASLGTATGPVKVCTTLDSLEKVKEGDILVASMTRPEYVMAMKKAAAIVTDEGGITSHAAIVSRELGKPCVIGTKKATKVLQDGWVVQVKANHGQVIIIDKKSNLETTRLKNSHPSKSEGKS